MHDVFISYSTKDLEQAETVRNVLEKNGIPCWMAPRDIPGGSNYTKEIPLAIRGCQVFLLILSGSAQSSQWVLKELDSAVNAGKVIIPFMLEDCLLNDEFNFLLTGAQRYAAYQKKAEALEMLISRIQAVTAADRTDVQDAPEQVPVEHTQIPSQKNRFLLEQCPACGGDDLEELTKRIGSYTPAEKAMSLISLAGVPLGAVAGLVLTVIVSMVMPFNSAFDTVFSVCLILGILAGGVLGALLPRELIRRQRVRKGMRPHPYRCKDCKKEFLISKK